MYIQSPLKDAIKHPFVRAYNSQLFMAVLVAGLVAVGYIIGIVLTSK